MTRLAIPLRHRTLWASGDILLRAEVDLLLKDASGAWRKETFRVDSGTEMTTMPAALARKLGLPMPLNPVLNAVHRQTGLPFRSGFLRVMVLGLDTTEYAFPCFFLGDPNAPVPTGPSVPRKLLGLSGVITPLRLLFDGDPTPGAPYGNLVVEKKRP